MIDDHQMLIYIMSFHAETKDLQRIRELVDLRTLHNLDKLTAKGLVSVAEKHKALFAGKDFMRAVLNRPGAFNQVSEIYSYLVNDGFRMKIFDDAVDAPLAWLGYDKDEIARASRFIESIREKDKRTSL